MSHSRQDWKYRGLSPFSGFPLPKIAYRCVSYDHVKETVVIQFPLGYD